MQPVALGVRRRRRAGSRRRDAALCSLHHLVGSATTAAVRLLGLDPFEVHALGRTPRRRASTRWRRSQRTGRRPASPLDLPATTSVLADILAEHHATWEVRLFAS